MKVNFIAENVGLPEGNGIYSAATRMASHLRDEGIEVDMNGSGKKYDLVHSHTPMIFSLLKIKHAKKDGAKIITHAHTTAEDVRGSFTITDNRYFLNAFGKYLTFFYNHADLVLTPSSWTKETLERRGVKVPIKVISGGIDTQKFKFSEQRRERFREQYKIGREDNVVYCVGLVFLRKGLETFFNAARNFPDAEFIWAGRQYPSYIIGHSKITKILESAPENVRMLGFVKDIVDAHCGSDILLFPSYVENQGLAILEAMSCGRPVILRNLPTYRSWGFAHRKNSMLSSSEQDFSKNLSAVLENKRLREKLSENGKKYVKDHEIRKVCRNLIKIYKNLIDSGGSM